MSDWTLITAYEQGELSDDDTIELFTELIHSGLAWQLQGAYGREATRLLEEGLIKWGDQ